MLPEKRPKLRVCLVYASSAPTYSVCTHRYMHALNKGRQFDAATIPRKPLAAATALSQPYSMQTSELLQKAQKLTPEAREAASLSSHQTDSGRRLLVSPGCHRTEACLWISGEGAQEGQWQNASLVKSDRQANYNIAILTRSQHGPTS